MTAPLRAGYASPGLRWGVLLEDHPNATWSARLGTASEVGVPDAYGGSGPVCIVTVTGFADGRPDVVAYKPVPAKGDADSWNVLSTKTLGRALKRSGYPDDMPSLKALMHWRERNAEVVALVAGHGHPTLELTEGDAAPDPMDVAALPSPDAIGPDEDDDNPVDAEVVDESGPPTDATMARLRVALVQCGNRAGEVTKWARDRGLRVTAPNTENEAEALAFYAESLADEIKATG